MKQARNFGVESLFFGGDGWNPELFGFAGDAVDGSYFIQQWDESSLLEESLRLIEDYTNSPYGEIMEINSDLPMTYDAIMVLIDAIKRAGNLEPRDIRDSLAETDNYRGATGTIRFNENGDPLKSATILRFEKGKALFVTNVFP
ncbi:MAG: ABC transporter substrate-binding protein [Spirochaetaceae bacterium]|nr:ABC transporter substrate-binding protein [Spirochaetaceae bacterium]